MGVPLIRSAPLVLFCAVGALLLVVLCTQSENVSAQTCNLGGIRTDCCPGGCWQQQCQQNGCCWSPVSSAGVDVEAAFANKTSPLKGVPWCFKPNPVLTGYRLTSITPTSYGYEATLGISNGPNVFGQDISPLHMTVSFETKSRLHVKIFDPNNKRWEVPNVVKTKFPSTKPPTQDYIFSWTSAPFGFAVQRASTMETIFNTTSPSSGTQFNGMIFEDQYLELSTQLPRVPNIYGLGERVHPLRLDSGGAYYTMFTTDIGTPVDINLYASHPFYIEMRNSTPADAAHGVFLLNSNGMDVYLGPSQLTYRVIGGVLDMYFFLGPTPDSVVQQYTEVIGRPYMPPYWSLGWHQCRYGWRTIETVENVVQQYAANNLPLDTIWTDIDYMEKYYDFTWSPSRFPVAEVQSFVSKLHANGQHYVPIVDCGIPNDNSYSAWTQGVQMDIFIKDAQGNPFIGKVWPGTTGWVDWWNPKANQYWLQQFQKFLATVPYDGIWIDMNEISNFCDGECTSMVSNQTKFFMQPFSERNFKFDPNNPPYAINNRGSQAPLKTKTLTMDSTHYGGLLEYNVHNMFGFMEANATQLALEAIYGKRAFVLSRSTFPGHGTHAFHWLGDNDSTWADLYLAIPGILNFQMFGIPMVGADICGFGGDTTEELCARWMQVGSFYPFARNHNANNSPPQEPYVWPTVAAISRTTLGIRYSLLPYYYTLFWQAHINGSTVARPLFFEFPSDTNCIWIDTQFLIGSGFLVTPVLQQGATTVMGYFPQARWYDYYTHEQLTTGPAYVTLQAPLDHINLHLRGGTIIPTQEPALTTEASRKNPFGLLVPLSETGRAEGYLYLDDGESLGVEISGQYTYIKYSVSGTQLRAQVVDNGYGPASSLALTTIDIIGVSVCPSSVTVNSQSASFTCDPSVLAVHVTGFSVPMNQGWTLSWTQ